MNIELLIDKILRNKASKEEIEIVEKWKAETEANLLGLRQIHDMLNDSRDLASYKEFDQKKAWQKIDDSIEFEEVIVAKPLFLKWLSAAAAVVFLMTASYSIFTNLSPKNQWSANSEVKEVLLKDGSKVWLNSYSSLKTINNFDEKRTLSMEGEAYFDVMHSDDKPFFVNINDVVIEVIGTEFNVKSGNSFVQIYVKEGIVKVTGLDKTVILKKGQLLSYSKENSIVYYSGNQHMNEWREGKLVFRSYPLRDALEEIGSKLNVSIDLSKVDMTQCMLSTTFQNESIADVLEELKLLFGLEYKMIDQNVDILNVNCD